MRKVLNGRGWRSGTFSRIMGEMEMIRDVWNSTVESFLTMMKRVAQIRLLFFRCEL